MKSRMNTERVNNNAMQAEYFFFTAGLPCMAHF